MKSNLEFGTAGIRALMGEGSSKINITTIRHITQAYSSTLYYAPKNSSIIICYDTRNNSQQYAMAAAEVFIGNGFSVKIFSDPRPAPELSFFIKNFSCIGGINITASHNTKEYNGYKIYNSRGALLSNNETQRVANKMKDLDLIDSIKRIDFNVGIEKKLIQWVDKSYDLSFINAVCCEEPYSDYALYYNNTKIVYTSFHGTGIELIPNILKTYRTKVFCVEDQCTKDGNFPTIQFPNPEVLESFDLAIKLAKEVDADFIIGTDPDADRMAALIKHNNEYIKLTGNQLGILFFNYIIEQNNYYNTMPNMPVVIKTYVTTPMIEEIARKNQITCVNTAVGFKNIVERKQKIEDNHLGKVIFSCEESCCYMFGDHVSDKDGVTASLKFLSMFVWYRASGKTLYQVLQDLYEKYGYYQEKTFSINISKEQKLKINLDNCQDTYYTEIDNSKSLTYLFKDKTKIIIRPSGTEPKIKFYIFVKGNSFEEVDEIMNEYSELKLLSINN